jgi:choline/glycine/proline betaine transport protein
MWVSIFGNAAIDLVRSGNEQFGQATVNAPEQGFYTLLQQYPAFPVIASIATFCGLLFYVTSADSGALVMANLTSYRKTPRDDASSPVRIFWAVATGLLTLAMLVVGGITALQNATIVMGLPFAFVMVLIVFGLYKALRVEAIREDSQRYTLPAQLSGRHTSPDGERAATFLSGVALPALNDVAEELREHGVETAVHDGTADSGLPYVELVADLSEELPFLYRVEPREARIPVYGDQTLRDRDVYYRLNVHVREGGQGYEVMGYTHSQLIDDVLDQYEQHVEFMRLNAEAMR